MLKEVTNSFKASLYQRINSPLYGTYLCSWMLYNWAVLLPLIFGNKKIDERITDFKTSIILDGVLDYSIIIMPMIFSIIILIAQPFIQRYLFIYSEWNKSEGLKKRDQFSSETLLTLDQSNDLRSSIQKINEFHQNDMKSKNEIIEEYKSRIEIKENNIRELKNNNIELIENHTKENSKLIKGNSVLVETNSKLERECDELIMAQAADTKDINIKYARLFGILLRQRSKRHMKKDIRMKEATESNLMGNAMLNAFNAANTNGTNIQKYANINNVSGLDSFEIRDTSITVWFKDKSYTYSYAVAGSDHVEEMKKCALAGGGLTRYININRLKHDRSFNPPTE